MSGLTNANLSFPVGLSFFAKSVLSSFAKSDPFVPKRLCFVRERKLGMMGFDALPLICSDEPLLRSLEAEDEGESEGRLFDVETRALPTFVGWARRI